MHDPSLTQFDSNFTEPLLTLDMYGMSLNLEFLNASSPLTKLSSKGESSSRVFII